MIKVTAVSASRAAVLPFVGATVVPAVILCEILPAKISGNDGLQTRSGSFIIADQVR